MAAITQPIRFPDAVTINEHLTKHLKKSEISLKEDMISYVSAILANTVKTETMISETLKKSLEFAASQMEIPQAELGTFQTLIHQALNFIKTV